uniref:Uncharacterized protein n=1 Tax=Dunaliella tertiolecta TaxID=3047 RepID=A0A7S3R3W0_DUNTE
MPSHSLQQQPRGRAGLHISWGPGAPHTSDEAAGADAGVLETTLRPPSMGTALQIPEDPCVPSAADYWLEERTPRSTSPSLIQEDTFEWAFRPSFAGSTWGGWGPGVTSQKLTESVTAASTELTASAVRALEARLDQLMAGIRGAVQVRKQLLSVAKDGAKWSAKSDNRPGLFIRPHEKGINKGMGPGLPKAPPSIPLHPHSRTPPHPSARPTSAAQYTNPAFPSHQATHPSPARARLHQTHHRPSTPDLVSAAQYASAAARLYPSDSATANLPGNPLAPRRGSMDSSYTGSEVTERSTTTRIAPDAPHIKSPARLLPVVLNISKPSGESRHRHHHHHRHERCHPQMELLTPPSSSSSSSSIAASFTPLQPQQPTVHGSGLDSAPAYNVQHHLRQQLFQQQQQQQEAAELAGPSYGSPADPTGRIGRASFPFTIPAPAESNRIGGVSPSLPASAAPPSPAAPRPQQPTNPSNPSITVPSDLSATSPSASSWTAASPSNATARPSSTASSPARASWASTATGPAIAVASALAGAPRPGAPPRDLPTLLRQVQAMRQAAESGTDPHALPAAWRELQQEVAAAVLAAQEGDQLEQEDQKLLGSSLGTDAQALPRPRPRPPQM